MPALNYQERFVFLVESGLKKQTIRPKRKIPIKPGDPLYHYTGMRTKKCRKLGESECKITTPICIEEWGFKLITRIVTEEHWKYSIDSSDLGWFARRDGFKDWSEMRDWFKDRYGLPFEGVLIEW